MSNGLEVKDVSAKLGEREVCRSISFVVREGGFASILGASGAGKSTLLRCVAGLTECRGEIRVGAKILQDARTCVPPEARGIGFLFQGLGLWPDHTVEEHLRMVLQPLKLARADVVQRIGETLEPLGLSALAGRLPGRLSGGERQRLALARALVTRPQLLLLDEPTSSVDQGLKRDVRELLDATRRREGCTVLHVTHDHEEALELADHLILMHEGCVVQQGPPASLWEQPVSRVVARMLGEGVAVEATLAADGTADTPFGRVATQAAGRTGPVWLLVRSSHLRAGAKGEGIPAAVSRKLFLGARSFTCVTVAGREHRVEHCDAEVGSTLWVSLHGCPPVLEERSSA